MWEKRCHQQAVWRVGEWWRVREWRLRHPGKRRRHRRSSPPAASLPPLAARWTSNGTGLAAKPQAEADIASCVASCSLVPADRSSEGGGGEGLKSRVPKWSLPAGWPAARRCLPCLRTRVGESEHGSVGREGRGAVTRQDGEIGRFGERGRSTQGPAVAAPTKLKRVRVKGMHTSAILRKSAGRSSNDGTAATWRACVGG